MNGTFTFADPLWFLLLLGLPFLLFLRRRPGSESRITFSSLKFLVALGIEPRRARGRLSFSLLLAGLVAGICALARPLWIESTSYSTASGIDMILAIDVSGSMETDDMRLDDEKSTRLEVARALSADFVRKRYNDRIGLVTFAAYPLSKSPITLQHDLLLDLLSSLNSKEIDSNGTAIGSAIAASATLLVDREDSKSKIIILVTDGSNTAGKLSPLDAAELAAELGIRIYTVAVGTEEGRVTELDTPRPREFDPETLQAISRETRGEYFRAEDAESFATAFSSINRLEKTEATRRTVQTSRELFTYPLIVATLLALSGLLLPVLKPPPGPH